MRANIERNKGDEAIVDARERIAGLKKTIAVYKTRKEAGDEWPGVELAKAK